MSKELVLLLTHKCNMSCNYCFMDKKNTMSMSREILTLSLKAFIKKFYNTEMNIMLFGGEPLLEKESIIYALEKIKSWPGISISVCTNGLLLNEYIDLFKAHKVKTQVSLDGFGENNKNRTSLENTQKIVNNLVLAIDNNIDVSCRLTITRSLIDTIPDTVQKLIDIGIKNINLMFDYNDLDFWINLEDVGKIVKILTLIKEYGIVCNMTNSDGGCSAGESTWTVDTDGLIYDCYYYSNNKKYNRGPIESFEFNSVVCKKSSYCKANLEISYNGDSQKDMQFAGFMKKIKETI